MNLYQQQQQQSEQKVSTSEYLAQKARDIVAEKKEMSTRINGVTGLELSPSEYSMIATAMSTSKDPDATANKFAQALTYSKNTGITFEDAYNNLDALNYAQLGKKVDVTQTGTKAVINSFKIGNLTVKRQNAAKKAYMAYKEGQDIESIINSDIGAEIQAIDDEIASLQDYTPRAWYTDILKTTANTLSYSFNVAAAAGVGKVIGAVAESTPVGTGLATLFSFAQGYSLTKYGNWYDNVKDGIDPEVADKVQTVSAAIQAAIESYLDINVGLVKSLGTGTAKGIASNTIKNMYVNGTLNKIGLFLTKYGINMASEGMEEFLQEITDEVGENIAYALSGKEAPNEVKDILSNSVQAFIGGASAAIILGLGDAVYETKMDVKYAQNLRQEAIQNPSKETFIKNHIEDERLGETLSRSQKSEILSEAYDKTRKTAQEEGVKLTEASNIDTDYYINDDFIEDPNNPGNDSAKVSEQPVEPIKRMDNGRLRTQESTKTTKNTDGTESHTLNLGSRGSSTRYGYVDYTLDTQNKTITIDEVRTRQGYENITRDAILEVERSYEGWNIQWNPTTESQQKIKEQLINDTNNPNRGNLQWFNEGQDVDTNIYVGNWIKKTFTNLTDEQSIVAAKLLEFTAQAQGTDVKTWINDHIQNLSTFDEKGKKGAVKFDSSDIKAIIYAGKNADFSTFTHETFHVLVRTSQAASQLSQALKNASQTEEFARYVNSHKQIIKMDLDEVINAIKDMGDDPLQWTRAQHEVAATFFESYLRDGKTFNEKLKNIFTRIADWFHRIYLAIHGENALNEDIVKAYDEILAGNPELKKAVETSQNIETAQNVETAKENKYDASLYENDEDNGLDEFGNPLYQEDNENILDLSEEFSLIKEGAITSKDVENYIKGLINTVFDTASEPLQIQVTNTNEKHIVSPNVKLNKRQQEKHNTALFQLEAIINRASVVNERTVDLAHNTKAKTLKHKEQISSYVTFQTPISINQDLYSIILTTERVKNQNPNLLDLYNVRVKKMSEADVYLNTLQPTHNSNVHPNKEIVNPQKDNHTLFQSDNTALEEYGGTLVVTHNLSESNIENIVQLGGMPMPSLAVTKPDIKLGSFGPITLVGDSQLAENLMKKGELFDRDMWSPTVPAPEYKTDKKALRKFNEWINSLPYKNPLQVISSDYLTSFQKDSPQKLASYYASESGIKLEYCKENNITVEIPYKKTGYSYDERIMKAAKEWGKENNTVWLSVDQIEEFQNAIKPVVDEVVSDLKDDGNYMGYIQENLTTKNFNKLSNLLKEAYEYEEGKTEIDTITLRQILDKVAPTQDVQDWLIKNKFTGIFSDPVITLGKSKVPYNVNNVFEFMRRSQYTANELGSLTFSNSLAASSGAKAMNTRQEVSAKENLLADVKDLNYKDAFDTYHDTAIKNYKYSDTWSALNDSNRAIAKYLASDKRTEANLKQQLKKLDFEVTDELVSDAQNLVNFIETMSRRYFEAKPRSIMNLSDFKYAIVPNNVKPSTVQTLSEAGLKIVKSDSREQALQTIAENDSKVLWQLDNETESSLIAEAKSFDTLDEFIAFEKAFDLDEMSDEELTKIWDKAHFVYNAKQEYVSPIDPNLSDNDKDEAFRVIMSSDEGITSFIERLREAFSIRHDVRRDGGDVGASSIEEYNDFIQQMANADRVEREAAPYIVALAKSRKEISKDAIAKVRGMINNSLRDYRDLYSQVIGDENFAAGVYSEYMPDIKDSRANGMRITERKDLASRLEGEEIREAVRRGTEKYDGTAEKVMAVYDKELKDLQEKYDKLSEDHKWNYLKLSREEADNYNKQVKIKKMESAIKKERQSVRQKLDEDRRVPTEQIQKLKTWEDEVALLHEEIKQLRKQDSVKATLEKREALDNLKKQIKEKQQAKAAAEAVHRYKRELYNSIVEKVPNNVDYSYNQKIQEIVATIKGVQGYQNDSITVSGKKMSLTDFRQAVEDGTIKIEGLSDYQLKRYLNTSLADLTISDLETLRDTVEYYKKQGKQMWQAKVDQRAYEAQHLRDQLVGEVYKSKSYNPEKDYLSNTAESDKVKKKGKLKGVFYKTLNWNRKAQILDNDTKGLNYDLTVEERRVHQDEQLRGVRDRVNPVKEILEENKLKENDFYNTVPIVFPDGKTETFTVGRLAYAMLAEKNERNYNAVAYGNLVTQLEKQNMNGSTNAVNQQIKKLGDSRYQALLEPA